MFNKERIENLEKRVKELERKEGISKLSEDVSKRLIHALIDSNNEVVKRVFDDVCVRSVYGISVFQPPKAGDIHARNELFSGEVFKQAAFNGIPDYLKKVEEDKTEAPTIASVLEKAKKNTMAIQELLKRTGCSNVNEVISKFELGVSYEKMYNEQISKRKELLAATGCANFSDLKNKFLCKDIKRDELIAEINELARQRELLNRDLRNQIAKLSDKNQSLMQSEKSLICKLAEKNEELKRVEEISEGRYEENAWLRGEMKKTERAVERLKKENKQLKSVNAERVTSTLDAICREADAVVGYSELKKRCEYLERDKKTLLASVKELQKQVFDISRDKKYLEMANASLLQETRKIRESLNERIKKLRQRLKKSSIRYRDLKEIISHNGLKSV
ncbi:putative chromosome segregation ATPase SMC superfamily protein [Bacteroides phage Barc2635]|nr:putative chromosome segregation ATPase SMC superfamily protein [Bacteroides phage Barc2635]